MEQELEENGLNPNPMFFWQYVLPFREKAVPCVYVCSEKTEEVINFAKSHPEVDFIFRYMGEDGPFLQNVRWVDWKRSVYKHWLQDLRGTDYLLCGEKNRNIWIQAGLCGVKCVFSLDGMGDLHTLTSVERIDNWEATKKLLA